MATLAGTHSQPWLLHAPASRSSQQAGAAEIAVSALS